MSRWEYKVMPAPTRGLKAKGLKGPEARFANALETLMNEMGGDGWEFQRAETLPSIERSGLTGTTTEWRNMLVFRRALPERETADNDAAAPELLPPPAADEGTEEAPETAAGDAQDDAAFVPGKGATQMLSDNGVEDTSEVAGMTTSLQKLATQRGGSEKPD